MVRKYPQMQGKTSRVSLLCAYCNCKRVGCVRGIGHQGFVAQWICPGLHKIAAAVFVNQPLHATPSRTAQVLPCTSQKPCHFFNLSLHTKHSKLLTCASDVCRAERPPSLMRTDETSGRYAELLQQSLRLALQVHLVLV